jgi:hypothetical protein
MDPENDRVAYFGGAVEPLGLWGKSDHWLLEFAEALPASVSLASVDASPWRVALRWRSEVALPDPRVERRGSASGWEPIGNATVEGDGFLRFEDTTARAGERHAYRLRWIESEREFTTPEVWVESPTTPALALEALSPNPSTGDALVSFVLPTSERAKLEVFDLSGRRVESRDLTKLGPGRHMLRLAAGQAPGLYLVRLTQMGASATRRWCVLR